jgi:hypothetical protein
MNTITRRLSVLLLAATLGVACDDDNPAGPDVDTVDDREATQDELVAARQRWSASRITHYDAVMQRSCFCTEDFRAAARVEVRNGAVVAAQRLDGRPVVEPSPYVSVERLFAEIQDAIDAGASEVRVTYDAALGFPTTLYIDHSQMIADEETYYEVRDLNRR